MDKAVVLSELENIAEKLDVGVSYEPFTTSSGLGGTSQAHGGLCRVKGHWRVIIDRRLHPSDRITVLVQALKQFDTESVFASPAVRALLSDSDEMVIPQPEENSAPAPAAV